MRLGQDAKHCAVQLDLSRSVELMALGHEKGNEWKYMEGMEANIQGFREQLQISESYHIKQTHLNGCTANSMAVAIALCCHGAQMLSLSPPCRSLLWRQTPPAKQKLDGNFSRSARLKTFEARATRLPNPVDRKCYQASPVGASQGSGLHSTEFGVKVPERQLLSSRVSSEDVKGRAPAPQGRDFA